MHFPKLHGLDPVVYDEAHRVERTLTLFRGSIWLVLGVLAIVLDMVLLGAPMAPALITTAWGVFTLVVVRHVLKSRFHPAVPIAITMADLAVTLGVMDLVYVEVLKHEPTMAPMVLASLSGSAAAVLSTNALRPWASSAIATAPIAILLVGVVLWHRGGLSPLFAFDTVMLLGTGALFAYGSTLRSRVVRRVQERDAFARFLPGPLVEKLSREGSLAKASLGGEESEATVLFADIRGFTTLSSSMKPAEVVAMLNEYFTEMVDEVFKHHGVLDKFIGDGMCAAFPVAVTGPDAAEQALKCALHMLKRLEALNDRRRARGEQPLAIGIGLHTGSVLCGNIGSPLRLEYTHIGDTVNTASRIEGLTKDLHAPLLASASTKEKGGAAFVFVDKGTLPVKGRPEPVHIFAVESR